MEKEKITFGELCRRFEEHNRTHNVISQFADRGGRMTGVVVFRRESWSGQHYTLKERSYEVASDNKAFIPGLAGGSIFGNCLDGRDLGVRLDQYMKYATPLWQVDYCYIK